MEQGQDRDRGDPGEQRQHFIDEAADEADRAAAEQQQDDGDADGPDAGREEGLDRVRVVDEGLWEC